MYRLRVKSHFDAAHYIKDYDGKCSREHGHRWDVELFLAGNNLDELNMLIDFGNVKGVLNDVIDLHLDHYQLNESLGVDNLTAEYLAQWLFQQMSSRLISKGRVQVVSVKIWESPDCSVEFGPGGER